MFFENSLFTFRKEVLLHFSSNESPQSASQDDLPPSYEESIHASSLNGMLKYLYLTN